MIWYYQELASKVGEERMAKYIEATRFGNGDISGGIRKFWLQSSLEITAEEQVDFLNRLYRNDLPFSQQSMEIVKRMIILSETDQFVFRGKTGSALGSTVDGKPIAVLGWFVGYLVRKDSGNAYVFATSIEAQDGASGGKARSITESILKEMKLM